ncbi:hypothetical protein COCSUDRAFT_39457 [Coccomyxa subellipsoidea C-169]|uniref:Phytocyanin domain-containing protein n=1 Tax=Coccomyxa subellipsoidea (strain C-169) TaxID=574566 RepID=I0Z6R9_COCSC|nr:hypothetical protein COCSUDRAFT_39457 [Coccomyxa subellipsoidea C-169]EIE26338.1 hypothetical protein COCSUDRAFT_39457 [Coccomyxa subellipsoidea C-169]|eukprot:XP_005650882.1 hypothetical protein COCSUDRAFT_39457 [Coccomyxa subellipsoidea C-169]
MQSAWKCLVLIGLAALGACAAGGLEADWASMQPLYQQGGLAANLDPLSPGPSTAVRTIDPWDYGNLYPDINVTAGTALRFVWHNTAHGVTQIPSRICPLAFNTSDIAQLAPVTNGGDFTTPPLTPGEYFYACPVFGHCLGGMMQPHGVYRIPSGSCPPQYAPGDGFEELGPIQLDGGIAITKSLAAGTYWYSCQVPGHCDDGQIVKVTVA